MKRDSFDEISHLGPALMGCPPPSVGINRYVFTPCYVAWFVGQINHKSVQVLLAISFEVLGCVGLRRGGGFYCTEDGTGPGVFIMQVTRFALWELVGRI